MGLIATSHRLSRRAQSEIGRASLRDILGPALNLAHNGGNVPGKAARSDTGQNAVRWAGCPHRHRRSRSLPLLH